MPEITESTDLLRLALQECLKKCQCQLDDDMFDRNAALLFDQVKNKLNELGYKINETRAYQIFAAAKVGYQDSSLVGYQFPSDLQYWKRLEKLIYENSHHLTIRNMIENKIFYHDKIYLDNNGLSATKSNKFGDVEIGSGDRILVDPIEIYGYAHDPVLAHPMSMWTKSSSSIYFQIGLNQHYFAFKFFKPEKIKIRFLLDLEFKVNKSFRVDPISFENFVTLGLLSLVNRRSKSSSWTYPRKIDFTIITNNSDWMLELKCLDLKVSQDMAANFLQMEARLINLKYKLKNHDSEEINRLESCQEAHKVLIEDGMDINQEIDVMIDFLEMLASKNSKMIQNFDSAEIFALNSYSHWQLKDYLAALKQLDHGDREALIKIIQLKSEIVNNYPTYVDLVNSQNENMLLGIAFEELMATKIIASARENGIELTRYEGDGLGILPNGQKTPQYSDLVFSDEKGNFYSYQMKFSDNKENIREMVTSFNGRHQNSINGTGIDGLSFENTKILVPGGFGDQRINCSDEVNLKNGIKVKMATVEESKKFLEKNYDDLQKFKNQNIVEKLKNLEKSIQSLEKKLINKKNILNNVMGTNGEANLTAQIDGLLEELDQAKNEIENLEESIENLKFNLSSKNLYRPNIKQILKQCAIICAVSAICSGVTYFIINLAENLDDYKSGKITGWELSKKLALNTAKGAFCSSTVSLFIVGGSQIASIMTNSTNSLVSSSGSILAKTLGPGFMSIAIIFQTMNIITDFNEKRITSCERDKLLVRMGASSSFGYLTAKVSASFFTGPTGICIAAGACIAIALGDYFLGDKIASLIFKEDENEIESILRDKCDEIEKEVTKKAYSLFCLTEHCTDRELKDVYVAAALKYHPDKCQKEKQEENKQIFQAVSAAYSYLKEIRNKS